MLNYRDTLYKKYSESFGGAKPFNLQAQIEVFENTYKSYLPSSKDAKILDLGCGKGEWLMYLKSLDYLNIEGVDLSESELVYLKKEGIKCHLENVIDYLRKTDAKYDLVHAKDLFEHFTKDEAVDFLELIYGVLNIDGEVMILTFNGQSPFSAVTYKGDFTHELSVIPSSIAQVMRATGYKIKAVNGVLPCRRGLKSVYRKIIYCIIQKVGGLLIKARHGARAKQNGVDVNTLLPDLIAIGKK